MKFGPGTRELTFPFEEMTESIELFGWFFYKQENVQENQHDIIVPEVDHACR